MDESNVTNLFSYGGVDGGPRVDIQIAADEMTAWATFSRATSNEGKLLVWTDFAESLATHGLVQGLETETLQSLLFRFNTEHPDTETIVCARGVRAVDSRPAFLRLEPQFFQHHFRDSGGAQVDFKEFSPILVVKRGQLLARGFAARPGIPGTTVLGRTIPPLSTEVKILKPGPHTLFAHGKVFSRLSGHLVFEGPMFDVAEVLELGEGVGYSTGNLTYPGMIRIHGTVADGFRVAGGAGIDVSGTLDASEVYCKGDLKVEGGIVGRKPGLVRAGGTLSCLYAERCQIDALGSVKVSKALLHVELCTNGDLVFDDGGRIVASSIEVKGMLKCTNLGAENGPVRVRAGTDFVVRRRLEALRARYSQLESQLSAMGSGHDQEKLSIVEKLRELVEELNHWTPLLVGPDRAIVEVLGTIAAGTVIEIGHVTHVVNKDSKGQGFRLGPDGKSIEVYPITRT